MLKDLYDEAKEERKANSSFLKLESGESFSGKFINAEKIEDGRFGVTHHFHFLIDGEEKTFNNKFKLLENMIEAEIEEGDWVKVKKMGKGFDTKYVVLKINPLDDMHKSEEDDEPDKTGEMMKAVS